METPPTTLEFSRANTKHILALLLLADFSFHATFTKDFRNCQDLDDDCQKTFAYPKFRNSLGNVANHYLLVKLTVKWLATPS